MNKTLNTSQLCVLSDVDGISQNQVVFGMILNQIIWNHDLNSNAMISISNHCAIYDLQFWFEIKYLWWFHDFTCVKITKIIFTCYINNWLRSQLLNLAIAFSEINIAFRASLVTKGCTHWTNVALSRKCFGATMQPFLLSHQWSVSSVSQGL